MWLAALPAAAAPLLGEGVALPDADHRPAYTVAIRLSDTDRRYTAEGTIRWTNRTGAPLAALPLTVPANAVKVPPLSVGRLELVSGAEGRIDVGLPSEYLVTFEPPLPAGGEVVLGFAVSGELRALPANTNDLFAQGLAQLDALRRGSGGGGDYGLLAIGDGIAVVSGAMPMVVPFVGGSPATHVLRLDSPIGDLEWNEPGRFEVTVTTPAGLRVVTNLVDGAPTTAASEQTVKATGVGVSDLVVVAARDWTVREERVDAVVVRSWARKRDASGATAVLAAGAKAVRFLERYARYPFTELDLVEASLVGGAGGVEFGGLALVGGFLYRDPSQSSLGALLPGLASAPLRMDEQRDFVVCHEVAHQWAPGLVGSDAWNHPVMDEPLAQYLAWRVLAEGKSTAEADALAQRQIGLNYAAMRLLGADDLPADQATSAFPSTLQYAGVIYGKAPGLYRALEAAVGRATLDRALQQAFAARAWTVTDPDGWLGALEAGGAVGARALAVRWWGEPHGDEDLALDPTGKATMELMVGPELAGKLTEACAMLGRSPAACLRMAVGGQ